MNLDRANLTKMGNYIANQRKKKGYTQKELAEFLDVSNKTISKWEQGIIAPDITLLKPLAQALDTNIDSIINGENHPNFFRYSMESKKYRLIIIFLMIFIIIATVSFYWGSNGKCEYYKIKSSGVFNVEGHLVSSDDESIIILENIKLNNASNSINKDVFKSATIVVYCDEKVVYNKDYTNGKSFTLKEFLQDRFVLLVDNVKITKDNLKLQINFYNLNDYEFTFFLVF